MLKRKFKMAIVGIITGIINGLFGAGGGMIVVIALNSILKIEQHKAQATALAIMLPLSIVSVFFYRNNYSGYYNYILWLSIGGTIGAYIGARLLNKVSSAMLHKILAVLLMLAGLRMVL